MSGVTTAVAVAIGAAVIGAAGTAYGAISAANAADEQAKNAKKQAKMEEAAAAREADAIHEKARRVMSQQTAALAGSGVKIEDSGSGAELLKETDRLAEQDALSALITGRNRATILNSEADVWGSKASSALISGGFGVVSGLAAGYNSYNLAKKP